VACDATGQYVAALSTESPAAFFHSQNYGNTFNTTTPWAEGTPLYTVAIAANAPNYVAVGGQDALYISTNTGQTFKTIMPVTDMNGWIWIVLSLYWTIFLCPFTRSIWLHTSLSIE
jgi:hypothetical protein